ncbi:conserved hypothetical protein [Anaeromyxobacter sp. K]|uniref:hypothetical protein n=1 Tax=Anaeromyxobacter sp. (strain K) TaxID=447217 RepID=UPI00015F8765|nr:hypothetical protein [Anaeromyxobacter sp. K]ACG71646.1 conserved hypothetical protein [Anaeromyxobacter sp. K]
MERRNRARDLIVLALTELDGELSTNQHRLCPEQLGTCRSRLQGYLSALDGDALPPKRDRAEDLGRLILDSWPYDVPLGQVILRAERAWRNA